MQRDIDQILIPQKQIASRVEQVAHQIACDWQQAQPPGDMVLLPVLTGAMVFASDLMRHLPLRLTISLLGVTGYPGRSTTSQGAKLRDSLGHLPESLAGSHVLIVDDILDSGQTLQLVHDVVQQRQPASVRSCVLLRKQVPRVCDIQADYVCFDIPDAFVVGYGLDFDGLYRNLPDIVTLRAELLPSQADRTP